MKKRNRVTRRRGWITGNSLPNLFAPRDPRKRKSFTFETLEQRFAFSVAPLELQTTNLSNDTPEGAAAILLRELQWAALQSASTSGNVSLVPLQLPTDPYFPDPTDTTPDPELGGQWHLLNIGQQVGNPDFQFLYGVPGEDINVVPAWELGYTGEGVIVAVLDDGVQVTHPDLFGNVHPSFAYNAFTGTNNASGNLAGDSHGTRVAGLIGATWSQEAGVPVTGGVGVAPEVTLVPIHMLEGPNGSNNTFNGKDPGTNAFRYALLIGADITNNSYGFPGRSIVPLDSEFLSLLRQTVREGRDGLGMIHVFASGNDGGTSDFGGAWNSATYSPYVSSRYVIGVAAVDHDGLYANLDDISGTVSSFANAGANVLVSAPTGTSVALSVANDDGLGSGLWTTDLVGDLGANAVEDPITGIDDDRDFLDDPNYTTRFNGTSGAAPLVSGVVALMLDANPNLTYRDVQEILVRSARQNAQFEIPAVADRSASYSSWQTNPMLPYRDPDAWDTGASFSFDMFDDPIADPRLSSFPYAPRGLDFAFPSEGNDFTRQLGHYELQPPEFTNGAGYTVSQGYGAYGELIGYAHGVVDAELAVIMARDWHIFNQDVAPNTERTYTTFISPVGDPPYALPPAVKGSDDIGSFLVPGGIQRDAEPETDFIAFYEEYIAEPPRPFDPADPDSWPDNTRGLSYVDFRVPVSQQINVEWVEVKLRVTGPSADLNYVKINLTSPNGMQSELNHYYQDNDFRPNSLQDRSEPADSWALAGLPGLSDSDEFVWTFSTNRNWGESTNSAVIMNPLTGEPQAGPADFFDIPQPIYRDWELHLENWSNSTFFVDNIQIVWHGKPVAGGQLDQDWIAESSGWQVPVGQRIQGFVGIDVDNDDEFSGIDPTRDNEWNNRYIQTFFGDPDAPRQTDLQRRILDDYQDNNSNGVFDAGDVREMEPYAANILVEAFEFTISGGNDIVNPQPIAQFLTGADGNYYFDLVPGNYIIRATDRNAIPGTFVDDVNTPSTYQQHYKDEWRITEDWFYAPDRDAPIDTTGFGLGDIPGEIFYDAGAQAPVAFRFDATQPRIPMAVKDINFLIKPEETPVLNVVVNGTVYADVNANGAVDIFDGAASNTRVFVDSIRNGQFDPGEQFVYTNPDGSYSLTVLASATSVVTVGVQLQPGWAPSIAGGNVVSILADPGDVVTQNFFLNPPDDPTGSGLGNITGFVFNDINANGVRDLNEGGLAGVTVYLDSANFGVLDAGEVAVVTGANGAYFFSNLTAATYRIDVVNTAEQLQTPAFNTVVLASGETRTGVAFGLQNLAVRDYGDLPAAYNSNGSPSHFVAQHFRLGETVDGEIGASPSGDATSNDGVEVLSNAGKLQPGNNIIVVQTAGVGGRLSGWIDWDNNKTFDADERLTFIDDLTGVVLGTEAHLAPSATGHRLRVVANSDIAAGQDLAMRFRWGEAGLGLTGDSFIGEVEDYVKQSTSVVAPFLSGDFNSDGGVNAADYVAFRKLLGTSKPLPNSTNPSGPVVAADETLWRTHYGSTAAGGSQEPGQSGMTASSSGDGSSGAAASRELEPFSLSVSDSGESPAPAVAKSAFSAFFAATSIDEASQIVSFASNAAADAPSASASAGGLSTADELLLLDQAIADLDDSGDEAPIADRSRDEDGYDDLALAAAFDDESFWWSL